MWESKEIQTTKNMKFSQLKKGQEFVGIYDLTRHVKINTREFIRPDAGEKTLVRWRYNIKRNGSSVTIHPHHKVLSAAEIKTLINSLKK